MLRLSIVTGTLVAVLAGCDNSRGIVLAIHAQDPALAEGIDRLEVVVWAGEDAVALPNGRVAVRLGSPSDIIASRAGVALTADDPFELFLPAGTVPDGPFSIAVIGYDDQQTTVMPADLAMLEPDTHAVAIATWGFAGIPDAGVQRYSATLFAKDRIAVWGQGEPQSRCVRWTSDSTIYLIGRSEDQDCDGALAGLADCNDVLPSIQGGIAGLDATCDGLCDDESDPDLDGVTAAFEGPIGRRYVGSIYLDPMTDERGPCMVAVESAENPEDCLPNEGDESLNGVDDNCVRGCDEGYDQDGDGYTRSGPMLGGTRTWTDGQGWTCALLSDGLPIECNDNDAEIFPGADDADCDGVDSDCGLESAAFDYVGTSDCVTTVVNGCALGTRLCQPDGALLCNGEGGPIIANEASCDDLINSCDNLPDRTAFFECLGAHGQADVTCLMPAPDTICSWPASQALALGLESNAGCVAAVYAVDGNVAFANGDISYANAAVCDFSLMVVDNGATWGGTSFLLKVVQNGSERLLRVTWEDGEVCGNTCLGVTTVVDAT